MDLAEARDLVAYTRWANQRALDASSSLSVEQLAEPLGGSFGSLRATLVHMIGAEWVWLERFNGRSPRAFPDGEALGTVGELRQRWSELADAYGSFVASLDEGALARPVAYTTFRGDAFSQRLGDLLRHVANHATYHRGQVTLMLRLLGATPAGTDLAAFLRERGASAP